MTDELQFGATHDKTKLAVLREAVERADHLAVIQMRLIESQETLIATLQARIKTLESELSEVRCAL
jgi:two-component sensor histidine kinase